MLSVGYRQPNENIMHTQQTARNIDVVLASVGATTSELQTQSVIWEETARWVDTDMHHEVSATRNEGKNFLNISNS